MTAERTLDGVRSCSSCSRIHATLLRCFWLVDSLVFFLWLLVVCCVLAVCSLFGACLVRRALVAVAPRRGRVCFERCVGVAHALEHGTIIAEQLVRVSVASERVST